MTIANKTSASQSAATTTSCRTLIFGALMLVACAADTLPAKFDTASDPVQDIVNAAGISGITAKASPVCESPNAASRFTAVGFSNARLRNGQSAAGFSVRDNNGTQVFDVGSVRKYTFLLDALPPSEDGCLTPDELHWNWDTDAQWVERDLNIEAATLAFEQRLFHAAAAMGFGLSQYTPRPGQPSRFALPLQDKLKLILQTGQYAASLRLFAAAALAQLHVGAHYDRSTNINDDAWLKRALNASYAIMGDIHYHSTSELSDAVCAATPNQGSQRHAACVEQARHLVDTRAAEPNAPSILRTTLASITRKPPKQASNAFVELLSSLANETDLDDLNEALSNAQSDVHPAVIGAGATGWTLDVGNGSVLKLAIVRTDRTLGASDMKRQRDGLIVLKRNGFAAAKPLGHVFIIEAPSGETYAAMYSTLVVGLKPYALARELHQASSIPPGLTIGAFRNLYIQEAERTLQSEGLLIDHNDDNYIYTGDPALLADMLQKHMPAATEWSVDTDAAFDFDVEAEFTLLSPHDLSVIRHWEDSLSIKNIPSIRAELQHRFSSTDAQLLQRLQHFVLGVIRKSPTFNSALAEHLQHHMVAVDPCI